MKNRFNPHVEAILQCPNCSAGLRRSKDKGYSCTSCADVFPNQRSGPIDFRLKQPKKISLNFQIPGSDNFNDISWYDDMPQNLHPHIDFGSTTIPHHLTKEMLSFFPRAANKNSLMLDLGCGTTLHRPVCERAGFTYVGVDYNNRNASFLADAHALPFKDNSYEFLLSIAVLEHIQFPFIAIKEAYRVLQPGGIFIGTVAFLEPFHDNSYYHHTRLGTMNTLRFGGFEIMKLAASTSWTVFAAQARMSHNLFFPRIPRSISRKIVILPQILSNIWLKICPQDKANFYQSRHADHTSGAFYFVVRKPD